MKKPMRIGTQLQLGFAILLTFVLVLGTIALKYTNDIYYQIVVMYENPLPIRRALGALDSAILMRRVGVRDLLLSDNDQQAQAAMQMIEQAAVDAERQFDIIRQLYPGPAEDVTESHKAYVAWKTSSEEIIRMALAGETQAAKERMLPGHIVVDYRDDMLEKIGAISAFSLNKADSLYADANSMYKGLNFQLILLVVTLLLSAGLISFRLVKSIRRPLLEMNDAVRRFHDGDMSARSPYLSDNEFGVLSASINTLADRVQENAALDQNTVQLAQVMLSEDDAQKFFQATLSALADNTGAHIAAVYLMSEDQDTFELFESIGAGEEARRTFRADNFEGEFGAALYTRKIHYIKNISGDTRFVFNTVNGRFIPREIIAIPILFGSRVIALLSLANLGEFSPQAFKLIDAIYSTMSSRIQGVLALRRIKEIQQKLQQQNRELDAQQRELAAQTAELTQQNTELEMQKKQLDEASQLKTNFLSNMSHELRTPLNSVIALTGVLNRRLAGRIGAEELSFLEVIERNGKSLLNMINEILDIARIEAGREDVDIASFHINDLIEDVVEMIRPQAEQKNIRLLFEPLKSSPVIASDAEKCRHILQNLIGNAVKFTENGAVVVAVDTDGDNLSIRVTDSGIGITPEQLPYIFDEFRQADGSLSRRYGGVGLGLAIAKRYALMLGGDISVKSRQNEGSVFTLSLPLRLDAGRRETRQASRRETRVTCQEPGELTGKCVLLVEDNDVAVIQIKDLVEGLGINVMVARNADEALALIEKKIPDAMILDLMMPGVDGFQLLEILRNAEPTAHTPVLILTAKHITKEELSSLKRNNIHQLVRKGDADREGLLKAITSLFHQGSKQPQAPAPCTRPPVVLVTEDDPDNMITAKALLGDRFTVLEAHDAQECIETALKQVPDLILMDIALSGMSGIEAFQQIRKHPQLAHIPVIALTASAMAHEREAILAHGFDAFIAKPIIEENFTSTVHEVLYGKKKL